MLKVSISSEGTANLPSEDSLFRGKRLGDMSREELYGAIETMDRIHRAEVKELQQECDMWIGKWSTERRSRWWKRF